MTQAPWPAVALETTHRAMTAPGSPFEMVEVRIDGRPTRTWKHAPPTVRELFQQARAHGPREFLVYDDERVTFDAFGRATLALAAELVRHGVRKGDRVALAMRNLPEWPVVFCAATLAGAIIVPLNAWWTGPELEYGLADSGARLLFCDAQRLDRVAGHLPGCPALERIVVSRLPAGAARPGAAEDLEALIGRPVDWAALPDRPLPDVPLAPDDDATILYTSGTTGAPKGALGTHRNIGVGVIAPAFAYARNFVRRGEPVPAPDPSVQKSVLLAIPFFHVTGSHAILCPALFGGTKLVLMHRWDPERAMQLIERERVTSAGGVPTIAWQLIEHPARANYDLSSLESVSYGGAPAASELVRRIREVFPKAAPGLGWGMTETASTFTGHSAEDYEFRPTSSGPALPICDMKIVDERGRTLPPNTIGELLAYGPNIVKGYWNKPQASAETFVDGWVRTGDLATIDEEGFLFVIDRKKDMLIRGGENIYCIEVEDALYQHPAVMDAAVVGIPHRTLGEEPGAVVTFKPGTHATAEELRAFVAGRLAAFKVPVDILVHPETLPRNANGKIIKRELKRLFAPRA